MYYPLWEMEKLEEFLHENELKGKRIKNIRYNCIFEFTEAEPKDTDYIATYQMRGNSAPSLYPYENKLKSEYKAHPISTEHTGYDIFRITGKKRDFEGIKIFIGYCLKYAIRQYLFVTALFLFIGIGMMLAAFFQDTASYETVFAFIFTFFSTITFIYLLCGYIIQSKKCKSKKMKLSYYSVFQYDNDKIHISFPDIPSALTCANNEQEGLKYAEEVLELTLHGKFADWLPLHSTPKNIKLNKNQKLFLITVEMGIKKGKLYSKNIKGNHRSK